MSQTFCLNAGHHERENVKANLHAEIDRLPDTKSWQIEIGALKRTQSDKQRKALFGAAYKPLMEAMGYRGERDKEDLHEFMCGEYWGWTEASALMKPRPVRTTTRNEKGERDEIDTATALDFYAFIQQRAAENGIYVPDPDPFWKEKARDEWRARQVAA